VYVDNKHNIMNSDNNNKYEALTESIVLNGKENHQ
jgi:hypothetical protein